MSIFGPKTVIMISMELMGEIETKKLDNKYVGTFNVGSIIESGGIEYKVNDIIITMNKSIEILIVCKAIDKTVSETKIFDEEDV